MRRATFVLSAGLGLALASNAHAIISTFDADLEGWTGSGGAVVHVAAGGNPGGFLQQTDTASTWMDVSAPAAFLGDLSSFLNGSVSFDAINLNQQPSDLVDAPLFGTVTFSGPAGTASALLGGTGEPTFGQGWESYSAPINIATFGANLPAVLANVTSLTVVLESNNQILESNGFDNFELTPGEVTPPSGAIPEPTTAMLGSMSLAAMGAWALRRRS